MRLFDFFKKKTTGAVHSIEQIDTPPINKNWLTLNALESQLIEMGYEIERHTQYMALIVNGEIEITLMVVESPSYHSSLMHLMVSASHPEYFPAGIIESVVGAGYSLEDQVNTALNNYIGSTFITIMESFSDSHNPGLDFISVINNTEVLWHPKLGNLHTQGQWNELPSNEHFFDLLKDRIPDLLTTNKLNWLKIYISKRANGEVMGECLFNNISWNVGLNEISNYAKNWEMSVEFKGLKQFIMFRRCDAYDEVVNTPSNRITN